MKQQFKMLGGLENILRAYEICKAGGFKMRLYPTKDIDKNIISDKQLNEYNKLLQPVTTFDFNDAYLLVEVVRPQFNSIFTARETESIEYINKRVVKALENPQPNIDINDESSLKLMWVAYDHLGLQPYEVEIIILIAQVIARLEGSTTIKVNHVAEAIQYRS